MTKKHRKVLAFMMPKEWCKFCGLSAWLEWCHVRPEGWGPGVSEIIILCRDCHESFDAFVGIFKRGETGGVPRLVCDIMRRDALSPAAPPVAGPGHERVRMDATLEGLWDEETPTGLPFSICYFAAFRAEPTGKSEGDSPSDERGACAERRAHAGVVE